MIPPCVVSYPLFLSHTGCTYGKHPRSAFLIGMDGMVHSFQKTFHSESMAVAIETLILEDHISILRKGLNDWTEYGTKLAELAVPQNALALRAGLAQANEEMLHQRIIAEERIRAHLAALPKATADTMKQVLRVSVAVLINIYATPFVSL